MSKHAPRGPRQAKNPKGNTHPKGPAYVDIFAERPRCKARSKTTGKQCSQYPIPGGNVCYYHGGNAPQVRASARERLMALQPVAIQTLNNLLHANGFPTVQLGAAKDVLDRTEGKAAESLQVTGADGGPIEISLVARLQRARKRTDGE